jgi:hypothetical protein
MWRHFDEPIPPAPAPKSAATQARRMGWGARSSHRRRLQVTDGLCHVARLAAPRARRRRHELLLISRAAAVRTALLEVAALVRCSPAPDPDCIAELHNLLTNGCDSPLYNPEVPAEQLKARLERVRDALATQTAFPEPREGAQGGNRC